MAILLDIINWVETKPEFWQIAIDRLIRNNTLSASDISELKEICKTNIGLSNISFNSVDFDDLKDFVKNVDSTDSISVSKIENIENINALSETSVLNFNTEGLNIIYGDNGAGKSSFVTILKHTCNTRGQKPKINPNLFNPNSLNKDKKAQVVYTIDNQNFNRVSLNNSQIDSSILKNVDVFDTFSANHYIEAEDEIAFIPRGLSIIEKLAIYVKQVENKLNQDLQKPALVRFNYESIIEVSDNCSAKKFLNNLNSTTTLNELRKEGQWNKKKSERLEELKEIIYKLKATDPKLTVKHNTERLKRFKILQSKYLKLKEQLTGQELTNLRTTLNSYTSISETLRVSSEKAFSNLPIDGIGSDVWKALWESARKFYNTNIQAELFPDIDNNNHCPLCLQDLNEEAKQRFVNFEDFVKNDIQKQYDSLLEQYNLILINLEKISFDFKEQTPTIIELNEIDNNFNNAHIGFVKQLTEQRDYLISLYKKKETIDTIKDVVFDDDITEILKKIIENIEAENVSLSSQSIKKVIEPLEEEFEQLFGEKQIYIYKPKLAREIYRRRKIKLIKNCIGKCNTRTITTFSNELTTKYVNFNLKQNFKLELKKLGFNNIKIETETKGARGKQYHYLRLNEPNSHNVSLKDILSEGEHRCISLATFLSELSISDHKSTIIFDDPVSSLDHKWRNRIAKRIVEEALNRQVIVFTHDITFLMMLQEHSKHLDCIVSVKSLTRKKKETGLIASNPPWDALTVKKRIGLLKNELVSLKKIEQNETEEIYKEKVKPFYGRLRETWERFVEEILLNKVIQRFGREIQTQRLKLLSDLTDNDYKIIDENMKKCSTYLLGHDSSGALIENVPDTTEIDNDIKIIEDYLTEMRKRKRQ